MTAPSRRAPSSPAPPASAPTSGPAPVDDDGRPLVAPADLEAMEADVLDPRDERWSPSASEAVTPVRPGADAAAAAASSGAPAHDDVSDGADATPASPAAAASPASPPAPPADLAPEPRDTIRARRLAERELAAVALSEPDALRAAAAAMAADEHASARLARTTAPAEDAADDAATAPGLAAWIADPGVLRDPSAHAIGRALAEWLSGPAETDAPPPATASIMAEVQDEDVRNRVAALHFEGQRLLEEADADTVQTVQAAIDAVIACIERQQTMVDVERTRLDAAHGAATVHDLAALIERRREHDTSPAAIARRPPGTAKRPAFRPPRPDRDRPGGRFP